MSKAAELAALIGSGQAQGNRNLIINGAMQVAQRGTSAVAAGNPNYPSIDRYKAWEGTDGAFTIEQSTDAPTGFSKSLKAQVTTADTSLAAGQYAQIVQNIEAQDLQHLDYGLSTAKTLTLSFWVKSSKTGTYCITAYKEDTTGSAVTLLFPKEYTISSANTWEKKTITIAPDSQIKAATGAIDDDNGVGIGIYWNLAQGSTYTGGTNATWSSNTNHFATTNQVNWMDSTSNDFYLTGIQLEIGDVATPFEHRSYGDEFRRCQRYFELLGHATNTGNPNTFSLMSLPFDGATNNQWIDIPFMVEKRAAPTSIVAFNGYSVPSSTAIGFSTNGMTMYHNGQMTFTRTSGGSQGDAVASVSAEL